MIKISIRKPDPRWYIPPTTGAVHLAFVLWLRLESLSRLFRDDLQANAESEESDSRVLLPAELLRLHRSYRRTVDEKGSVDDVQQAIVDADACTGCDIEVVISREYGPVSLRGVCDTNDEESGKVTTRLLVYRNFNVYGHVRGAIPRWTALLCRRSTSHSNQRWRTLRKDALLRQQVRCRIALVAAAQPVRLEVADIESKAPPGASPP